jgi:putative mRNA 3-end processing factor
MLEVRSAGLYCPAGDFYIDPADAVDRAVITHAHPDRARPGSRAYLTTREGEPLIREICPGAAIESVNYGTRLRIGDAIVSLHPAGHILGSAQVRIERHGEVWVAASDFRLEANRTCTPFEPQRCHTFATGAAFGLPIFRWPAEAETASRIHSWWRSGRECGKLSVLFTYPLGKAQMRAGFAGKGDGPDLRA